MADTIEVIQGTATVVEVAGPTGPQGPAGASQADVLTTQGDLLYRGASAAARLGIGTAGQVLKVNSGGTAPEWGAAGASGVSSVAGRTGDVTLAVADVSGAASSSRQISTGTGLTGGGDLSADRTLAVSYGTTAGTATQGNDTRIVNILKSGEADGAFTGGTGGSVNLAGGSALAGRGAGGAAGSIDLSGGNAIYDAGEEQGHAGTAAGSIDLSGRNGGGGGSITMRGALNADGAAIHGAGSINLSAGGAANFGNSSGGSIVSTGGSASGQNGGTLNMSGGSGGGGGSIDTSNGGGLISSAGSNTESGGSLNLSAGAEPGGSINTSDGGGSINTRGTGSIGLGVSGTRTTLTGTATADRAISLPDTSGTIALLSNFLGAFKDAVVLAPSSDMSVTSNATLADISGMSWTAAANTSYLCACAWQVDCGAGGFQMVLDCPSVFAGGSSLSGYGLTVNGANTVAGLSQGGATEVRAGNRGAAQTGPVFSIFAFRTSSTSGTAKFRFAQNGSNAAASVLKAQSRVLVIPLT